MLPDPISMDGLTPAVYWIRYFLTGHPIPFRRAGCAASFGGTGRLGRLARDRAEPCPRGNAGRRACGIWSFREKARKIFPVAIGVLIALIFLPVLLTFSLTSFNFSWLLWVFILFWLGNVRTQPLDDITELDTKRRALGFFVLFIFFLIFTPIPMVTY